MAATLSLSMIVRNEEAHLARALRHANTVADEIIVLDTGSTDRTPEIAEQCGATVHRFAWCDDFAKARNESLRHCTKEFVMWLDADDVLEQQDAERVRALLNEAVEWDALYLPYQLSKSVRKKPPRVFRNGMGIQWIYPVHEILRFPPGTRRKRDIENICINHQPLRHRAANSPTYLRLLKKAIRTPEFANSNYMLWHIAKEYSNLRDLPKAVYYFQQAIQHASGTESYLLSRQYLGLARQYRRLGNLPLAISAFGNAALYYPGWREPYCGIAEMLWELGDLNSARACVEIARKIARHSLGIERLELYDATNFHTEYVQRAETLMESRPQRATHKPSDSSPSFTLVAGGDVCLARQM